MKQSETIKNPPAKSQVLHRRRLVTAFLLFFIAAFIALVLIVPFPSLDSNQVVTPPLPDMGQPIEPTPEDRQVLQDLGTLRLGVDPDWEPYEVINQKGEHEGIAADLLRIILHRAGAKSELLQTKDWDETIRIAQEGRLELVGFLNASRKREEYLIFTEPYFVDSTVLITHMDQGYIVDLASLSGAVVALPSGTSIEERLRRDYPNLNFLITANEQQAFEMVSNRQADLTVRSLTMAAWTIRMSGLSNLKISGQIPGYDNLFRVGVRKDLPALRDLLDKAVATLTPQEVRQVVDHHVFSRLLRV